MIGMIAPGRAAAAREITALLASLIPVAILGGLVILEHLNLSGRRDVR